MAANCFFLPLFIARAMKYKTLKTYITSKLFPKILSLFGDFYYTTNKNAITLDELQALVFFPMATLKKDSDIFLGKYKNIKI